MKSKGAEGVASVASGMIEASRALSNAVSRLRFAAPVEFVYNPLEYAREPHEAYISRYGTTPKTALLLGMNPGPFGMAQTGVPFGDVTKVRDFLGVTAKVARPPREHPKRPVLGFGCTRSEVSGTRLWGWAEERFGSPQRFFETFFVVNYCPLAFLVEGGRNLTPDKLPAAEREPLFQACDAALRRIVELVEPRFVIGVGAFAEDRARRTLPGFTGTIGCILHPSPASPKANRGWGKIAEQELRALGVPLP
jgi:single-strand selective monofunctional uracil DNA glycosylase